MKSSDKKSIPEQIVFHISTNSIFKVIVIALILALLWFLRDIILVVFLAILVAALVEPFANWMYRKKIPRGISVVFIYVISLALIGGALVAVIPPLADQVQRLGANFDEAVSGASAIVDQLYVFAENYGFRAEMEEAVKNLRDVAGGLTSEIPELLTNVVLGFLTLFIVLALAFYMVVEEDAWRQFFRRVAPDQYQPYLTQLFTRMQAKVGQWLRGQLLLMLIVGLASFLGLLILGVEYALVLGVFSGLMEVVPYAGPFISAFAAFFVAITTGSPLKAILVLVLYAIIQQLENTILTPKIMQKVGGLNPIVTIVALMIGFKIAGIGGAILAIPVAMMVSVFLQDILHFNKEKA